MKKILSAVLTAAVISAVCSVPYAEAEEVKTYDAGMKNYEAMAECLAALGGAEYTDKEELDSFVSREEFCEIIITYLGLSRGQGTDSDLTPFIDVEPSRASYSAIKAMYDMNYMTGDDTRRFYPEKNITVAEAATVAVRLLGYGYEAEQLGDYPQNNIKEAYNKEILTERFDDYNSDITLGSVYRMLYDMLEVPIMELKLEHAYNRYSAESKNTMLNTRFDAERLKGKVTANRYTGLSSYSASLTEGQIGIEDKVYQTRNDYNDMLGLNVIYYVSYKDFDDGMVVYMTNEYNTITTVNADDIEKIADNRLTYRTENKDSTKLKNITLDNKLDVIYNGVAYTGYGALSDIEIKNGSISLIDNNRDGKADVMDITEYTSYYISGINKTERIVYDYDKSINISLDSSENIIEIFNTDGTAAKFSDLKKNTLISVAESKNADKPVKRVYICEDYAEGAVEMLGYDECVISGTTYKIAPDFEKDLSLNIEGVFYLDINGRIAAFKSTKSTDFMYGIVYKCWYDAAEEQVGLKIFTEDERFTEYIIKNSISINGSTLKAGTSVGGQQIVNKLQVGYIIRYRLGESGELSKIELPLAMVTDRSGNKSSADSSDFRTLYEGSSFKHRNGMLDGKVIITNDTVIFSIPKSGNWSDTDMFGTLSTKSFSGGTSYSKNYKAYAVGENPVGIADAMIVEDMTKGSIGNTTNMVFVTDVKEGIDPDNDICQLIEGVSGGNTVEYYCVDETLIAESGLKRGDVIRVGVNSANKVNKIEKIYNCDGSSDNNALLVPSEGISENTASFDSEYRVAIGTVQDMDNGYMKFTMKKSSGDKLYDDTALCRTEGAVVVKYDTSNKRNYIPSPCSVNEILRGDTVIIRMNLAVAKEIIILR